MEADISKIVKSVDELNIKIINIGKRIDSLEKTSGLVEKALNKIPYAVADAIDKNMTSFTLDTIKEDLNEIKLTSNDVQRSSTFLVEALTREKLKNK
ncbi:MAG: hypothetical protein KAJ47_02160 [Candidatus Aenigmarchaeota archaeon]|nr:hypothetical protein [Candidatus Aenigmarchaeota archaeon]